jgi:hypothetical protein
MNLTWAFQFSGTKIDDRRLGPGCVAFIRGRSDRLFHR